MWYKDFLPKLHQIVRPNRYVEIGIRHGYSLSLSPEADKIAIDPAYGAESMQFDVPRTRFFRLKSDDFFAQHDLAQLQPQGFDLAYIDGLHLFEFALRDFMNLERYARPDSVIIVDDVIPRSEAEATRVASGGAWAGDVWKLVECLRDYRPDLYEHMILARSEPTGCLIVRYPDRSNQRLRDHYDEILERYLAPDYRTMPDSRFREKSESAAQALAKLDRTCNARPRPPRGIDASARTAAPRSNTGGPSAPWRRELCHRYSAPLIEGIDAFYFSLDGGGRDLVAQVIRERNIGLMLEIGCFLCGSTVQWLEASPDLVVVGVDPWSGDFAAALERYDGNPVFDRCFSRIRDRSAFIESVRRHGPHASAVANVRRFGDRFVPVKAVSPAVMHELADLGLRPGLIYFDSNKVLDDLTVARELFPDAILCGDDWTWGADQGYPVRTAVGEFCKRHGDTVEAKNATWLIHRRTV